MPKSLGLMSQKSPIYKYAKKKGITEDSEHDVLLDILKAGRNGKTLPDIEKSSKEYKDELTPVLHKLIKKGVIIYKGKKFIGIYAGVNNAGVNNAGGNALVKALAKVIVESGEVIKFPMRKVEFDVGDKVQMVFMDDPQAIEPGTKGTITFITKIGAEQWQVGVDWDNGRTLKVLLPEDHIVKV